MICNIKTEDKNEDKNYKNYIEIYRAKTNKRKCCKQLPNKTLKIRTGRRRGKNNKEIK